MKVNMTPNPLDVVTIHASQGDTEARQWEFELHNNGELIDTSDVKEQLVFKAYKGGTEQLLPENGSTPTTSPFIGDIRYPQGLLTDQEFTYRQSPTEEDGNAKIIDIKGNTLVWNQLVQNGNFNDTTYWNATNVTFSVANNTATVTRELENSSQQGIRQQLNNLIVNGNKYLISFEAKSSVQDAPLQIAISDSVVLTQPLNYALSTSMATYRQVFTAGSFDVSAIKTLYVRTYMNQTFQIKNIMLIDLSAMFGQGNEPATIEDFTSLFPLSYYSYNQGSLLSFMGNGIKTVGKNLYNLDEVYESVAQLTVDGNKLTIVGTVRPSARFNLPSLIASGKLGKTFTLSWNLESLALTSPAIFSGFIIRKANNTLRYVNNGNKAYGRKTLTVTLADGERIERVDFNGNDSATNYGTQTMVVSDIQLEISSTATSFEPYTSSTLSLPISTYFPTGMKSAGNAYDELTPSKAITRIGSVDLGSLEWTYVSSGYFRTNKSAFGMKEVANAGVKTALYETVDSSGTHSTNMTIWNIDIQVRIINTDYTDATAFKNSLQGQYLYYELVTETETSFTTASLVTENAEIPLSNNDGVLIGKCTEELSAEPGFHDAKIKLADGDGECYSNKLQLHVERSPQ